MTQVNLVVKNNGPSTSNHVVVTFQGLDLVEVGDVSPSQGEFHVDREAWVIGSLESGEQATLTAEMTSNDPLEERVVVATVYGDALELNEDSNKVEFVIGGQYVEPRDVYLALDFYIISAIKEDDMTEYWSDATWNDETILCYLKPVGHDVAFDWGTRHIQFSNLVNIEISDSWVQLSESVEILYADTVWVGEKGVWVTWVVMGDHDTESVYMRKYETKMTATGFDIVEVSSYGMDNVLSYPIEILVSPSGKAFHVITENYNPETNTATYGSSVYAESNQNPGTLKEFQNIPKYSLGTWVQAPRSAEGEFLLRIHFTQEIESSYSPATIELIKISADSSESLDTVTYDIASPSEFQVTGKVDGIYQSVARAVYLENEAEDGRTDIRAWEFKLNSLDFYPGYLDEKSKKYDMNVDTGYGIVSISNHVNEEEFLIAIDGSQTPFLKVNSSGEVVNEWLKGSGSHLHLQGIYAFTLSGKPNEYVKCSPPYEEY